MRAAVAIALVATAACRGPWLPVATEADAARAQLGLADLNHGRKLLIRHCSGCHLTPSPRDQEAAAWPSEVADMQERSGLEPAEAALITQYLVAFATAPR